MSRDFPMPDPVQVRLATELRKAEVQIQELQGIAMQLQAQRDVLQVVLVVALQRVPRAEDVAPDAPVMELSDAEMAATRGLGLQVLGKDGITCAWLMKTPEEFEAGRTRDLANQAPKPTGLVLA